MPPRYDNPIQPLLMEQVVLEKLRVGMNMRVGEQLIHDARTTTWVDHVTNDLVVGLETYVLAQKLQNERIVRGTDVSVSVKVESGPLQRWKERHRQSWWLRWFVAWRPVRWATAEKTQHVELVVDVEDYATFPENNRIFPDDFGHVIYQRHISPFLSQFDKKEP